MVLTTMEAVCHGKSLRGLISSSFASSSSFISLRKPSALFPLQPKKTFVSLSQHAPGQNTFPLASSSFSLSLPSSVSSSTSSCGAGDCFARRPSFEGHRRCARRSICSVSASSVEQEEEKLLREILKDLESLRQSVKSAARQFKSPMFQQYFLRRVRRPTSSTQLEALFLFFPFFFLRPSFSFPVSDFPVLFVFFLLSSARKLAARDFRRSECWGLLSFGERAGQTKVFFCFELFSTKEGRENTLRQAFHLWCIHTGASFRFSASFWRVFSFFLSYFFSL